MPTTPSPSRFALAVAAAFLVTAAGRAVADEPPATPPPASEPGAAPAGEPAHGEQPPSAGHAKAGEHVAAHGEHGKAEPWEDEHAPHRLLLSVAASMYGARGGAEPGTEPVGGAGVFLEGRLHRYFALELDVRFLHPGEQYELPIDLLAKGIFEINHWLDFYVGVGPTFVTVLAPEATMHFGGALGTGFYVWFTKRVGALAEFDYNLIWEGEHALHEIGGSLGLVFGL